MGFLPRSSFSTSHLSKLSYPFPTPHTQVPSPSSSSPSPSPRPPMDLMGTDSSGASGFEEVEDEESAEDLERLLLSLCSSSDEEMEARPSALGDVGGGWAMDDGDGGFLELRDLVDGEFAGEEGELGDGVVIDGDGFLDGFGVLEMELMEVGDSLVGLEEVVRR